MRSKSHENVKCLEYHLHLWCGGVILMLSLLKATQSSHTHLHHSHCTPLADSSHVFACLVFQGMIKAVMWFLTEQSRGSSLLLSTSVGESTVFNELVKKHPDPSPVIPVSHINLVTTTYRAVNLSSLII